uniref:Uncharacterized protein n=1 Tax=Panagrolaimus sp. JU765 TaxID=591449 RepID=A0AC34R0J6_9BILA
MLSINIFKYLQTNYSKEIEIIGKQYVATVELFIFNEKSSILTFAEDVEMLRNAGVEQGDEEDLSTTNEKTLGKLVRDKYNTDFYILDSSSDLIALLAIGAAYCDYYVHSVDFCSHKHFWISVLVSVILGFVFYLFQECAEYLRAVFNCGFSYCLFIAICDVTFFNLQRIDTSVKRDVPLFEYPYACLIVFGIMFIFMLVAQCFTCCFGCVDPNYDVNCDRVVLVWREMSTDPCQLCEFQSEICQALPDLYSLRIDNICDSWVNDLFSLTSEMHLRSLRILTLSPERIGNFNLLRQILQSDIKRHVIFLGEPTYKQENFAFYFRPVAVDDPSLGQSFIIFQDSNQYFEPFHSEKEMIIAFFIGVLMILTIVCPIVFVPYLVT